MLPDISKRRKMYGYDRKRFDSDQLHAILELGKNDGCTTRNCVEIVKKINDYLEESRYVVVEMSTIFYFLKDLYDLNYRNSDCEILRAYDERVEKSLIGSSMTNIMKICKSVAAQRRLMKRVKRVIKVNRLSSDWAELLSDQTKAVMDRLSYLQNIVIPANLENTPLGAYSDFLSLSGITVSDDIRMFVSNSGIIFDDDDLSVSFYKDHVVDILCKLDEDASNELLRKATLALDSRNANIERMLEEKQKEDASKMVVAMEECKEEVLSLCSNAGKNFRRMRDSSLHHRAKMVSDVWVVAAATIKPRHVGYLKRSGKGRFGVSNIGNAAIFNTEQEAYGAAKCFCDAVDGRIAEIAKVELYSYGIGL